MFKEKSKREKEPGSIKYWKEQIKTKQNQNKYKKKHHYSQAKIHLN